MAVINNLESTSTTDSLSANMGRELNEYAMAIEEYVVDVDGNVSNLETRINNLEESSAGTSCECKTNIWTTAN